MVIVPEDADVDVAEHIDEKDRQSRLKRSDIGAGRYLHLQDHDGDDNRHHAISERLEPPFGHRPNHHD